MTNAQKYGMLWFVGSDDQPCEILNNSRTRHYQSGNPLWTGNGCEDCDCPQDDYDPCNETQLVYGTTPWDTLDPIDGVSSAPWADVNDPCSNEFLGFMIMEIDGLDYGHVARTMNQRGGDGSNLTPMRLGGREITFSMIATATTECGMRWGLDWLAASLMGIGGRCGYGRVIMRLFCPEDTPGVFNEDGIVEFREVALKAGPVWDDSNSLPGYECMVRGVRFTLVANDPCMYGCQLPCLEEVYNFANVPQPEICVGNTAEQYFCGPLPPTVARDPNAPCCEVEPTRVMESRAAIVTIENIGAELAGGFVVDAFGFLPGLDCNTIVSNQSYYLGSIGVGALLPGQFLKIDGAAQTVWFKPTANADWQPDDSLLVIGDEYPCFPRIAGCDSMYVTIRPLRGCVKTGDFRVTIESVSILGCTVCA